MKIRLEKSYQRALFPELNEKELNGTDFFAFETNFTIL
jgi:hypothetical protein